MQKWIYKNKNKKGFTLIELVVVIAILGILAALAIPRLSGSRLTASISAHNANVRTIESAATIFLAENTDGETEIDSIDDIASFLNGPPAIPAQIVSLNSLEVTTYDVTATTDGNIVVTPGRVDTTTGLLPK